jgi:hypothetical protein
MGWHITGKYGADAYQSRLTVGGETEISRKSTIFLKDARDRDLKSHGSVLRRRISRPQSSKNSAVEMVPTPGKNPLIFNIFGKRRPFLAI